MTKGGVLILVAGPSGAGKDTLISAARERLSGRADFVFPKRVITRADRLGEDHVYASADEFERLRQAGKFFLSWRAHGLSYGIPASVLDDLKAGKAVVFNISRRLIGEARAKWANVEVISVTAAPGILRERLRRRARESEAEIEERVGRAKDAACKIENPLHTLDNSGDLDEAIARFLGLLLTLGERRSAHEAMAADKGKYPAPHRLA